MTPNALAFNGSSTVDSRPSGHPCKELCDVVASRDDEAAGCSSLCSSQRCPGTNQVDRIRSQLEVYEDRHDLQCMLVTSVTSKEQIKAASHGCPRAGTVLWCQLVPL